MARRKRASTPSMRARATSAELLDGAASASPAPASATLRGAAADPGASAHGAPPGTTDVVDTIAPTPCFDAPQPIGPHEWASGREQVAARARARECVDVSLSLSLSLLSLLDVLLQDSRDL